MRPVLAPVLVSLLLAVSPALATPPAARTASPPRPAEPAPPPAPPAPPKVRIAIAEQLGRASESYVAVAEALLMVRHEHDSVPDNNKIVMSLMTMRREAASLYRASAEVDEQRADQLAKAGRTADAKSARDSAASRRERADALDKKQSGLTAVSPSLRDEMIARARLYRDTVKEGERHADRLAKQGKVADAKALREKLQHVLAAAVAVESRLPEPLPPGPPPVVPQEEPASFAAP